MMGRVALIPEDAPPLRWTETYNQLLDDFLASPTPSARVQSDLSKNPGSLYQSLRALVRKRGLKIRVAKRKDRIYLVKEAEGE